MAITYNDLYLDVRQRLRESGVEASTLEARELVKLSVLKNCMDNPHMLADMVAERTHSQVVQVIGKKIVLYREGKDKNKKIELEKI